MKATLQSVKSVRKTWGFCPITRKVEGKNKYTRKQKHRNSNQD